MNRARYIHGRARRWLETALYFGVVGGVLLLSAWLVIGPAAVLWLALLGGVVVLSAAKIPLSMVLRRQGARPVRPLEAPELYDVLGELARRAALPRPPSLYFIPSPLPQAFAVSSGDRSAIAVTGGLLSMLAPRELAGVLAHEMSHLRNGDTRLLMAARWMAGVTRSLTSVGFFVAIAGALLLPESPATPLTLLVLIIAPGISALGLLALSRTREFDADMSAAGITGDPRGLASGLLKLRAHERRLWRQLLPFAVPEPRIPDAWRTHPQTEARVRRLLRLLPTPPGDARGALPPMAGRETVAF